MEVFFIPGCSQSRSYGSDPDENNSSTPRNTSDLFKEDPVFPKDDSGVQDDEAIAELTHRNTTEERDVDTGLLQAKLEHAIESLEKKRTMECKRIAREVLETAKISRKTSPGLANIFSALVDIFNKVGIRNMKMSVRSTAQSIFF